ncbi:hypothetical protein L6Q96_01685 [Candidatus Binatia bacterium]|nr:hypothetical protein [Candidatus Binatia bacterium]
MTLRLALCYTAMDLRMKVSPHSYPVRRRCHAAVLAVVFALSGVVGHRGASGSHGSCADAVDCPDVHAAMALVQPVAVPPASNLVAHASGHPHRGGSHDARHCPACRSLQHSTVALAAAAIGLSALPEPTAADTGDQSARFRDRARGASVPRAPPVTA